tara:strand:+ start:7986 stop:8462 length:477 start_codon:yes stop_codon:yes gene_type:complete
MTKDIHLTEFGSGGELSILGNDLVLSEELLQAVYLALFGGNVEASTKGNELETEERLDWWANSLLYPSEKTKQFNSFTENALSNIVLNSAGRIEIQRAVEKDLEFLANIADVNVEVSIATYNRLDIRVQLIKKSNQEEKNLQLVFDNASNEVLIYKEI